LFTICNLLQRLLLGVLEIFKLQVSVLTKDVSMVGGTFDQAFPKALLYEMRYSVIWDNREGEKAAKNRPFDSGQAGGIVVGKLGSWTEALAIYEES
jgi:hypothetical protein